MSPTVIAGIVGAVAVLGFIVWLLGRGTVGRGFAEFRADLAHIRKLLGGSVSSKPLSVTVSGHYRRQPTSVTLSQDENEPGLVIRIFGDFRLNLLASPTAVNQPGMELIGRLDGGKHFIYSKDAARTKGTIWQGNLRPLIAKICVSSRSYLEVSHDSVELSEMTVPSDLAAYCARQCESLAALAEAVAAPQKGKAAKKSRILLPVASAVAVAVVAVAALMLGGKEQTAESKVSSVEGVKDSEGWRMATAADFPEAGLAWLRGHGREFNPEFQVNFSGEDSGERVLLLQRDDARKEGGHGGSQRIVILAKDGSLVYDAQYDGLVFVTPLPKSNLDRVHWIRQPEQAPEGDGLLYARQLDGATVPLILFRNAGHTLGGAPSSLETVPLD